MIWYKRCFRWQSPTTHPQTRSHRQCMKPRSIESVPAYEIWLYIGRSISALSDYFSFSFTEAIQALCSESYIDNYVKYRVILHHFGLTVRSIITKDRSYLIYLLSKRRYSALHLHSLDARYWFWMSACRHCMIFPLITPLVIYHRKNIRILIDNRSDWELVSDV